jgi:hypothetical protein
MKNTWTIPISIVGTLVTIFGSVTGWMITHSEQVTSVKYILNHHELLKESVQNAVTERLEVHGRVDEMNRRLQYAEQRQDTLNLKVGRILFGKLPLDTVYRVNRQGLLVRTPVSSRWLFNPYQ